MAEREISSNIEDNRDLLVMNQIYLILVTIYWTEMKISASGLQWINKEPHNFITNIEYKMEMRSRLIQQKQVWIYTPSGLLEHRKKSITKVDFQYEVEKALEMRVMN